jgi:hypothetical protein
MGAKKGQGVTLHFLRCHIERKRLAYVGICSKIGPIEKNLVGGLDAWYWADIGYEGQQGKADTLGLTYIKVAARTSFKSLRAHVHQSYARMVTVLR